MGIDIYLEWDGMTTKDHDAQVTGFRIDRGHVGYLREAYHGSPYVTKILLPEAFNDGDGPVEISASVLKERLLSALEAAEKRELEVYHSKKPNPKVLKSFKDFVALVEKLEKAGKHPKVHASY
jgi:hypothetical protein